MKTVWQISNPCQCAHSSSALGQAGSIKGDIQRVVTFVSLIFPFFTLELLRVLLVALLICSYPDKARVPRRREIRGFPVTHRISFFGFQISAQNSQKRLPHFKSEGNRKLDFSAGPARGQMVVDRERCTPTQRAQAASRAAHSPPMQQKMPINSVACSCGVPNRAACLLGVLRYVVQVRIG